MAENTRGERSTPMPQTEGRGQGSEQSAASQEKQTARRQGDLSRRQPSAVGLMSPFASLFQRWNQDMDRLFQDFGFGSGRSHTQGLGAWIPQVEVDHRGSDLIVRADLPGLQRKDIEVEIDEDTITIAGERRDERTDEREGWYRTEREYGRFQRVITLPEGTIVESARATFKDGVLEIVLQAPPKATTRSRRLEIG